MLGGCLYSWGRCIGYTVVEVVRCFGYCDGWCFVSCGRGKGEYGTCMQYRTYFVVLFLVGGEFLMKLECFIKERQVSLSISLPCPTCNVASRSSKSSPPRTRQLELC